MWAVGLASVALVALVVAVVLNFMGVFAFTSMDGQQIAGQISTVLSAKAGQTVHVSCPASIPEKKGGIEDCQANAGHGTTLVRLVQDDSRGHFHYNVGDPTVLAAPVTTAPSPDATYDPGVGFLETCRAGGGASSYCGCLLDAMQAKTSPAELERMVRAGLPLPTVTQDMMMLCRPA